MVKKVQHHHRLVLTDVGDFHASCTYFFVDILMRLNDSFQIEGVIVVCACIVCFENMDECCNCVLH